jgi:MinD superfamily P-loop ATPase
MRELVIISGKGGTGKTSITAAFASMAANYVLCDSDVDAADLHLLMDPQPYSTNDFVGGSIAVIRQDDCTACGTCLERCKFDAISDTYEINPVSCEGCGVCVDFCPEQAIDFPKQTCGQWFLSESRMGPMVHARLGIAEENSGKLVSLIRQQARMLAEQQGRDLIITDGPPGVGCPVIAAITGATALLIIVEPSLSSLHDMRRVAELGDHFKIPQMLCINKYDINLEISAAIKREAEDRNIEVVGVIPFDPAFTHSMVNGQNIIEYGKSPQLIETLSSIWGRLINSNQMCTDNSPSIPIISTKQ